MVALNCARATGKLLVTRKHGLKARIFAAFAEFNRVLVFVRTLS